MSPRKQHRRGGADGRGMRSSLTGTGYERRKIKLCRSGTFEGTLIVGDSLEEASRELSRM